MKIVYSRDVSDWTYFVVLKDNTYSVHVQHGDEESYRLCGAHNERDGKNVVDKIVNTRLSVK